MTPHTVAALARALGVAALIALPHTVAAQGAVPLARESRVHSDSTSAPLSEPPGGKYKKVSTLVPLPDFVPSLCVAALLGVVPEAAVSQTAEAAWRPLHPENRP
jgi:hypothetical protein